MILAFDFSKLKAKVSQGWTYVFLLQDTFDNQAQDSARSFIATSSSFQCAFTAAFVT